MKDIYIDARILYNSCRLCCIACCVEALCERGLNYTRQLLCCCTPVQEFEALLPQPKSLLTHAQASLGCGSSWGRSSPWLCCCSRPSATPPAWDLPREIEEGLSMWAVDPNSREARRLHQPRFWLWDPRYRNSVVIGSVDRVHDMTSSNDMDTQERRRRTVHNVCSLKHTNIRSVGSLNCARVMGSAVITCRTHADSADAINNDGWYDVTDEREEEPQRLPTEARIAHCSRHDGRRCNVIARDMCRIM